MISEITGIVTAVNGQDISISLGALGLEVMVPDSASIVVGESQKLAIAWHWNAEQGPSLYGFLNPLDKTIFTLLVGCSGIGPKLALAVLADLGAQRFVHAVQAGDEKALSTVSGIGAKKAEQLMVQLKHKVAQLLDSGVVLESDGLVSHWQTVTQALLALNYSRPEVNQAINHVRATKPTSQATFDQLLRSALNFLSR